ncbi:type 4a pilus biogenesis protein PilO [Candidatus Daviesbacteria bacterium]|nr:type 4a pilus biogenesis protein PilO [Candidatus Daviesbacteria bacterium]
MDGRFGRYYTYIKPVLRNSYVRTYSSLVFSLIAIVFFGVFAIRPTLKTIFSLQKDIAQQEQVLKQLTQKSTNLELGRQNYLNLDLASLEALDRLLPNNAALADLIDDLQTTAFENNASISGLQFQPIEIENSSTTVAKTNVQEVVFTINMQGSYQALLNVLDSLINFPRLISLSTVSLNKIEGGPLVLSINGKALYLK